MGETTKIQWTDASYNPWYGCRRVSPGCAACYAARDMKHYGKDFDTLKKAADGTFYGPLHWKKGRKIFTCSWSDFFIRGADKWREAAWDIMLQTPHHTYQILTKREQLMVKWAESHPWPDHIWAGVSVENQDFAYRLDVLAKVLAKVRFVSAEPLLSALDLRPWFKSPVCYGKCGGKLHCPGCEPLIHWVIAGGESGPGARPCHPDWIRSLRDQCQQAGVPFFFKQWGEYRPLRNEVAQKLNRCIYINKDGRTFPAGRQPPDWFGDYAMLDRVGTKAAGARLDGQEHQDFPV